MEDRLSIGDVEARDWKPWNSAARNISVHVAGATCPSMHANRYSLQTIDAIPLITCLKADPPSTCFFLRLQTKHGNMAYTSRHSPSGVYIIVVEISLLGQ